MNDKTNSIPQVPHSKIIIRSDTPLDSLEIPYLQTCLEEVFNLVPAQLVSEVKPLPQTPEEVACMSGYDLSDCIRRLREIKYLSRGAEWESPISQFTDSGDGRKIFGRSGVVQCEQVLGSKIDELLDWDGLTHWLSAGEPRTPPEVLIVSDNPSLAFSACMYLRQEGVQGAKWWKYIQS